MIKQLMYKWFGLSDPTCLTCEVLRDQLDESNRERKELLTLLMEKNKPEPPSPPINVAELQPIRPQNVPWRVRQQLLEQEDRKTAQLLREKSKELNPVVKQNISALEEELGVNSVDSVDTRQTK